MISNKIKNFALSYQRPLDIIGRLKFRGKWRRRCAFGEGALECGPASLATVAQFYGRDISTGAVADLVSVGELGSTLADLVDAAKILGFEAQPGVANPDALYKMPLPAIVRWDEPPFGHYVVVYEVTKTKVVLANPATGMETLSIEAFTNKWTPRYVLLLRPSESFEPSRFRIKRAATFLGLILRQRIPATIACVLAIVAAGLGFATPLFTRTLIDDLIPNRRLPHLEILAATVCFLLVTRAVILSMRQYLLEVMCRALELMLARSYLSDLFQQKGAALAGQKTGDLFNRTFEIPGSVQILITTVLSLLIDLCILVGLLTFLTWYSLPLSLCTLACLPVLFFLSLISFRPMMDHQRASQYAQGSLMGVVFDALSNLRTIKALGCENLVLDKLMVAFQACHLVYEKRDLHANKMSAFSGTFTGITTILLLSVGASLVMSGSMSLGRLMLLSTVMGTVLGLLDRITPALVNLQRSFSQFERIQELSTVPKGELPNQGLGDVTSPSLIDVHEVSYSYRDRGRVLHKVSLVIKPRQMIAIVGETGSGKSTLASLISGLQEPTEGAIHFGGRALSDIKESVLRKHIGIVFQETGLLNTTIYENVTLGDPQYSEEDIWESLDRAGAAKFVGELPYKLHTPVGLSGLALSSGQRQRIAIARVLLRKPQIVILDEATSNLDAATERTILTSMRLRESGPTLILITHRLTTAMTADRVYLIKQGQIIESGTHEELLLLRGNYSELWNIFTNSQGAAQWNLNATAESM